MNETKDLIIGIDFGKKYSQICYYDRKGEEPPLCSRQGGEQSLRDAHLPLQKDRSGRMVYRSGGGILRQRKRRFSHGGSYGIACSTEPSRRPEIR